MKKNIIKILGILLLVILQLSFFSKLEILGTLPNLIYLVSISLVLLGFFGDSLLVAVFGGLLLDLASPLRFGIYTLLIILTIFFLDRIVLKNIPGLNWLLIFLIYLTTFLGLNLVIFLIIETMPNWQIIIDAVVNSFWGIIIYLILIKFIKHKEEIKMA